MGSCPLRTWTARAASGVALLLCAASTASAATIVSVPGYWAPALLDNNTGYNPEMFTGVPNLSADLGNDCVTFDFSLTPIVNDLGAEFYVYEAASGIAEFGDIDVLVSADGVTFTSVKSTEKRPSEYALPGGLVPRPEGDTLYTDTKYLSGSYIRGYDLTALGETYQARYVRVAGKVTDTAAGGFDLNTVGALNAILAPEPSSLALLGAGVLAAGGVWRRASR